MEHHSAFTMYNVDINKCIHVKGKKQVGNSTIEYDSLHLYELFIYKVNNLDVSIVKVYL